MFKVREIIQILERNGFFLKRSSKHAIYFNGITTVAVPHDKTLSKGLCRRILQQANLKHEITF